jgi:hypothetical protein
MNKAAIVGGYEYHLLNGTLYITAEKDGTQVVLSEEETRGLVQYVVGTLCGEAKERPIEVGE